MIQRTLSKTQMRIFVALAQQRRELQQQYQEIAGAEQEQIEMLRQHFGLPEGEYQVKVMDGDVVLVAMPVADSDDEEEKKQEK